MKPLPGSLRIVFAGQEMALLPGRAIWWPACESLVIADLHLGKAAAFRMRGIPVPTGSTSRDLSRLTELLTATGAERLVILGDFLHARAGRQPEVLDEMTHWRKKNSHINILLIRGNHDRSAGRVLPEWDMHEVEEPYSDNNLSLIHHPELATELPAMAGHIHPVTPLHDFDGSTLNVPCFIHDSDRLILPSFGTFTGGHCMRRKENRKIYLAISGRVIANP